VSKKVQEILAWLLSPDAIKVILVEVNGVNKSTNLFDIETIYMSTKPYISESGTNYNPCIVGGISYSETMNLEGNPSINFGDLEIDNSDGSNDIYLTYIWKNREVNMYIGDARWNKADFSLIFSGTINEMTSRSRGTINLSILDKMAKLNTALTEKVLGSGYVGSLNLISGYTGSNTVLDSNKDALRPLLFGECFNVTPLQVSNSYWNGTVNRGNLYQVHDGAIENILEVRDNGAPVSYEEIASSGMFALHNASYGTITASVQGRKSGTFSARLADVIIALLTQYGNYPLSAGDLDMPVASTTPYVGYYAKDRENVLDVCYNLANTSGYQLVNTTVTAYVGSSTHEATTGKVKLIKVDMSSLGTETYTITDDDMLLHSMTISDVLPVKSSIKLGYCKNWTVEESNLAEGLVENSKSYFTSEWLPNRYVSSNNQYLYKDTKEPEQEDTYLLTGTDAVAEATRRATLYGTPRFIFSATYLPHMLFAQLGDVVLFNIVHPKFSTILNGKKGIIYSIQRNWIANTITIGVLV
jgi:hypothetical protein